MHKKRRPLQNPAVEVCQDTSGTGKEGKRESVYLQSSRAADHSNYIYFTTPKAGKKKSRIMSKSLPKMCCIIHKNAKSGQSAQEFYEIKGVIWSNFCFDFIKKKKKKHENLETRKIWPGSHGLVISHGSVISHRSVISRTHCCFSSYLFIP